LALLIFAPLVAWNHTHENAFWIHIHAMGTRGQDQGFTFRWIGEFLGAQAILISPLLFFTYLWTLRRPRPHLEDRHIDASLFLWCPSLVVFSATMILSLSSRVEGNWAVAAYMSGLILMGAAISRSLKERRMRIWHGASVAIAGAITLVMLFPAIVYHLGLKIPVKADRMNELYGWRTLAQRVQREKSAMPGPVFVFGTNYRIPSELAFYLPSQPQTFSLFLNDRTNEYMFWEDPTNLVGENAIYVNDSENTDHIKDCRAVFDRVEVEEPVKIYRSPYKEPIRTLQVFRCYGFKGYERKQWQKGW
jgi:hypothetical protein